MPLPWRLFWISGRASQREFIVVESIAAIAINSIILWQNHHGWPGAHLDAPSALALLIFFTGALVGSMTFMRRLQDIGESPYLLAWIVILTSGLAGLTERAGGLGAGPGPWLVALIWVACFGLLASRPSELEANKYGPPPGSKPSPPDLG